MPVYTDNRLLIGSASLRKAISEAFAGMAGHLTSAVQLVAGTATAGIPFATTLADLLELPLIFVRSKAKEHGTSKLIEGPFEEGANVLLIEDLISTGKSSLNAANALAEAGLNVLTCFAVFSYGFPQAKEAFRRENLAQQELLTFEEILSHLESANALNDSELETLRNWREDPFNWAKNVSAN